MFTDARQFCLIIAEKCNIKMNKKLFIYEYNQAYQHYCDEQVLQIENSILLMLLKSTFLFNSIQTARHVRKKKTASYLKLFRYF